MSAPGAVATADTGTLTTGFAASVVTAMLPLALPADCGAKVTVKLLRWPAARVRGKLSPLILKPLPVTVAWRTVRSELPELIRVADWVWLAPIFTLPKARLVGRNRKLPGPHARAGQRRADGTVGIATQGLPGLIASPPKGDGPYRQRSTKLYRPRRSCRWRHRSQAGVKLTPMLALSPACKRQRQALSGQTESFSGGRYASDGDRGSSGIGQRGRLSLGLAHLYAPETYAGWSQLDPASQDRGAFQREGGGQTNLVAGEDHPALGPAAALR